MDASRRRDRGGSGLGCPIARALVEAHGGRIWAESDPGSGATVRFELPGYQPRRPHRPEPQPLAPRKALEASISHSRLPHCRAGSAITKASHPRAIPPETSGEHEAGMARRRAAAAELVKRLVAVFTLALAAGFAVLAQGATPGYQKQRHAAVVAAARRVRVRTGAILHHHHRRRRRGRGRSVRLRLPRRPSAGQTQAPTQTQAPVQTQAPAQTQAPSPGSGPNLRPAPTQQAPAATSGGS